MKLLDGLKDCARRLGRELHALHLAYRDPYTPWYAKAWSALVVGYAFSPIDLIPDFIPILGYLDDLILLPLGIYVALRLIPDDVIEAARAQARKAPAAREPMGRVTAVAVVTVWFLLLAWAAWFAWSHLSV